MKTVNPSQKKEQQIRDERLPYEAPAVIHESLITTRAGTVTGNPGDGSGIDPTDLFGS
jgi:hypothetical protein